MGKKLYIGNELIYDPEDLDKKIDNTEKGVSVATLDSNKKIAQNIDASKIISGTIDSKRLPETSWDSITNKPSTLVTTDTNQNITGTKHFNDPLFVDRSNNSNIKIGVGTYNTESGDLSIEWCVGSYKPVTLTAYVPNNELWCQAKFIAKNFIKIDGTASQFLKADGSVDENNYVTKSQLENSLSKYEDTVIEFSNEMKTAVQSAFNNTQTVYEGASGAAELFNICKNKGSIETEITLGSVRRTILFKYDSYIYFKEYGESVGKDYCDYYNYTSQAILNDQVFLSRLQIYEDGSWKVVCYPTSIKA